MEEKSMLKSAFVLTFGNITSRLLGLIYVFPFAWLVGQEGQALYSYAYVPYVIFIDLATLGIPLGISKFVSIYNAQNDYKTSYNVFKKATNMMFIIGVIMFIIMFILSKPIAYKVLGGEEQLINNVNDVTLVIRVISTALIIVPSIALLRGFFQGFKYTYPTALSQIVEQIVRVLFILVSAYVIIKVLKLNYTTAITYSVLAATIAAIVAYVLLRVYLVKFLSKYQPMIDSTVETNTKSYMELFKELFKYAIPIALFGVVTSLYTLIDTLTFNEAYMKQNALNSEIIYGTYAFEINKLIMIPVSLGIGLGVSIIVYISESFTKKNYSMINKQIYKAFQTCSFIIIPIVITMMLFSNALYSFLFNVDNFYGPKILLSYAPVAIILCFNHIVNAIMQGINKPKILFISMTLGISLKYLYNVEFVSRYGYNGAILATSIGLLVTMVINLAVISRVIKLEHVFLVRRLLTIFALNIGIGLVLYLFNFIILRINVNYYSRFSCFLFLAINTLIYLSIYLTSSYFTGLLDIILGYTFKPKKFLHVIRNKFVTNNI
ncbi:MAG: cell division protein [Haloplasmataceae bacterium]|nr:cell division protein [Haloplasmataceae bacterium]